jgi:glyoxylase-like metal-dependent hydrolase (beta-lactamase superfamily II)
VLLRPFLNDATSFASYLFGCGTHAKLAIVDPHAELVDDYLAAAAGLGAPIVAVFETHVQADHLSGLPAPWLLHASLERLLELPDHVVLYPSHYAGSVCGRGVSSIGFERAHNPMLAMTDAEGFADGLLAEMLPSPAGQERIVAANRAGWVSAAT